MLTDTLTKFGSDDAAMLNGEISYAFPRVEHEGPLERLRRARVEAARTRTAALGDGRVSLEFERRDDLAEKHQRAHTWHNKKAIFPHESEPRTSRPRTLEHGSIVTHRTRLRGRLGRAEGADKARELAQLLSQTVMVVTSTRIPSYRPGELGIFRLFLRASPVTPRKANDAFCAAEDFIAVQALPRVTRRGEPRHPAVLAILNERLVALEVGLERNIGTGHAHRLEAESPSLGDDLLLESHRATEPGGDFQEPSGAVMALVRLSCAKGQAPQPRNELTPGDVAFTDPSAMDTNEPLPPTRDTLFGGAVLLAQPARGSGYRVNVDALLLAAFAAGALGWASIDPVAPRGVRRAHSAFDLGSGVGAVGLSLLHLDATEHVTMVEVDGALAQLAKDNATSNGWTDRVDVRTTDASDLASLPAGAADLVVCNPPYVELGRGRPPAPDRARARTGRLDVFLDAARRLAGRRARVCFVYPANEAVSLLTELRARGLEPKRLRAVHGKQASHARVVLVECLAGRPGGLSIEPPFVEVQAEADTETRTSAKANGFAADVKRGS